MKGLGLFIERTVTMSYSCRGIHTGVNTQLVNLAL